MMVDKKAKTSATRKETPLIGPTSIGFFCGRTFCLKNLNAKGEDKKNLKRATRPQQKKNEKTGEKAVVRVIPHNEVSKSHKSPLILAAKKAPQAQHLCSHTV